MAGLMGGKPKAPVQTVVAPVPEPDEAALERARRRKTARRGVTSGRLSTSNTSEPLNTVLG